MINIEKNLLQPQDYWDFQLVHHLVFWRTQRNAMFQKLNLFPFSGEGVGKAYFVGSIRKGWPQSQDALVKIEVKVKVILQPTASSSWYQAPIWDPRPILSKICLDSCGCVDVGRPLWWEDGSVICSAMTQVQFQVILRPTVSQPVRLGAGPPMGAMTRFLISLFDNYFLSSRCRARSPISPMNRVI
jgi:hypothetical protein